MAKQKDPNKKHYFDQMSIDELKSTAPSFVSSNSEVIIWEQGRNEDHVEKFLCKNFDELTLTLYLDQQKEGLLSSFFKSKYIDKEVFLRIGNGREQTFSTSTLRYDSKSGDYSVTFGSTIFKSLQRQNYRLNADAKNKVQVKLGEGLIFDGLDISAGGMSFEVSEEELEIYTKGLAYTNCTIRFNRQKYAIEEITIAGNWPLPKRFEDSPQKYKIGLSFTIMNPDIEESLFKEINSVARVQEMTKSLEKK